MPIWLGVVGIGADLTVPAVTTPMLVWHLLYGFVLGLGYYLIERQSLDS